MTFMRVEKTPPKKEGLWMPVTLEECVYAAPLLKEVLALIAGKSELVFCFVDLESQMLPH